LLFIIETEISTSRVSSGWTLTDKAKDRGAPTEEEFMNNFVHDLNQNKKSNEEKTPDDN